MRSIVAIPTSPARLRVLVAAALPADVGAIASALGNAGHEVVTAYRAETALARLADGRPDLLLLDLALPDGEGVAIVARARARTDAPILVIADLRDEAAVVAALDAGAVEVLGRPVRVGELIARLGAAVRRLSPRPAPSSRASTGYGWTWSGARPPSEATPSRSPRPSSSCSRCWGRGAATSWTIARSSAPPGLAARTWTRRRSARTSPGSTRSWWQTGIPVSATCGVAATPFGSRAAGQPPSPEPGHGEPAREGRAAARKRWPAPRPQARAPRAACR